MGEHLPLQAVGAHTRYHQFGHPGVLVADRTAQVFPSRIGGVLWRVCGVERDMAGAAGHAEQKWRLDRSVGQAPATIVGPRGILGDGARISVPGPECAAVQLAPAGWLESRIWKFPQTHGAGRGTEGKVAGVCAPVGRIIGRRVLEVAGGIAIARLTDERQQFRVTVTPVEAVGFFVALGGTAVRAGPATTRVVDQAPDIETFVALVAAQHPPPVDQDAHALLKDIGVKAIVARSRLVPDFAARTFGRAEVGRPRVKAVVVECGIAVRFVGRRTAERYDCCH